MLLRKLLMTWRQPTAFRRADALKMTLKFEPSILNRRVIPIVASSKPALKVSPKFFFREIVACRGQKRRPCNSNNHFLHAEAGGTTVGSRRPL